MNTKNNMKYYYNVTHCITVGYINDITDIIKKMQA